jgi:hypothetical protein
MALTRAPTAKIIKVSECRGGFDVTCQVLMIRGLNVNYYFAFDVLWVRERGRHVCGCRGKLHPRGSTLSLFPLFGGAQIMNAKRAPHSAAGEGWQWQIGSPPCAVCVSSLTHSSSCSGQKQKAPDGGRHEINTKKSSACWRGFNNQAQMYILYVCMCTKVRVCTYDLLGVGGRK